MSPIKCGPGLLPFSEWKRPTGFNHLIAQVHLIGAQTLFRRFDSPAGIAPNFPLCGIAQLIIPDVLFYPTQLFPCCPHASKSL